MADIASLVSQAVTGAAIASSVGSLIDTYKKAVPRIPDSDAAVKAAAQVATPTSQQATVTNAATSTPVADIVSRSRSQLQTLNAYAYPSDPSPFEATFNFIAFKNGNDAGSGRQLISKGLREVQDSQEIVKLFNTTIVLPLPANLVDNLSIQYEQFDEGVFAGDITAALTSAAGALFDTVKNQPFDMERTLSGLGKAGSILGAAGMSGINAVTQNPSVFEAAVRSMATGSVRGVTGQIRANIINPQRTLQFNGVEIRNYEYTWRFSPNSSDESETIKKIVRTFQVKSLPDKTDKYFLKYPDLVQVRFSRLEEELYEHKLCFIEAVNVNYAPSGQPAFFAGTDSPVEIEMTIKLRETSIRTREDYASHIYGSEGE